MLAISQVEEKKKLLAKQVLLELNRRKREEKIRYWKPHPQQEKFVRSKAATRLVLGGNRAGKSESGCIEAISHALGCRWYLSPDDPDYKIDIKVPNFGRVCGEDYRNHIGNVIIPKLKEWVPKGELEAIKKNPQGIEVMWVFKNGSTIELMTYEQDADKFEGSDNDWIWFDEPPPRAIYIAATRGLIDRNGKCWFTMTPLKEAWIKNEIWDKQKDPVYSIEGFIFTTFDNIGYGLTQGAVDKFERQLTSEEKQARLHGKFLHLSGLVYPEFDYSKHVVKPFEIPKDWPIFIAIDPHPRTPHAVMFMAVDPQGTKYVFDELFRACLIEELAAYIRAKLGNRRAKAVLIDPSSIAPNPVTGVTIQKEFTKYGIFPIPASKELSDGIHRVKKALSSPIPGMPPEVYFFPRCKETIFEFNNYVWDEWRGRTQQYRDPKNRPRDKDDHMMENLYRLLLYNPRYQSRNREVVYQARSSVTGY